MANNGVPFYPSAKSEPTPSPWLNIVFAVIGLAVTAISGYTSLAVGRVDDKVMMLNERVGRVENILMNGSGRK